MLKSETIEDLKNVFESVETELNDLEILPGPEVEVINFDLIRVHINSEAHPENLKNIIFDILRRNNESGPLNIHIESATTCRLVWYVDISTI